MPYKLFALEVSFTFLPGVFCARSLCKWNFKCVSSYRSLTAFKRHGKFLWFQFVLWPQATGQPRSVKQNDFLGVAGT